MTDTLTRPGYSFGGYPLPSATGPYCGNCGRKTRHPNADFIRECYAITREQEGQQADDLAAELAVERYFEDRGYDDARAQDEYEARHGVIGFIEAWHNQSPETCPCDLCNPGE